MIPALAAEGTRSCAGKIEFPQGLKPAPYEDATARLKAAPLPRWVGKMFGVAGTESRSAGRKMIAQRFRGCYGFVILRDPALKGGAITFRANGAGDYKV